MFIEICWHVLETFLKGGKASDDQKQLFRSGQRIGSLGSEILLLSRQRANLFLQLSSRTEMLAYSKVLLVCRDSANVRSMNKHHSPGKKQSCQHNCMSSNSFGSHSSVVHTNVCWQLLQNRCSSVWTNLHLHGIGPKQK